METTLAVELSHVCDTFATRVDQAEPGSARATITRASLASTVSTGARAEYGAVAIRVNSTRPAPNTTTSTRTRTVVAPAATSTSARNAAVCVATLRKRDRREGNEASGPRQPGGELAAETFDHSRVRDGALPVQVDHALGAQDLRLAVERRPGCVHLAEALPVRTRSDCFAVYEPHLNDEGGLGVIGPASPAGRIPEVAEPHAVALFAIAWSVATICTFSLSAAADVQSVSAAASTTAAAGTRLPAHTEGLPLNSVSANGVTRRGHSPAAGAARAASRRATRRARRGCRARSVSTSARRRRRVRRDARARRAGRSSSSRALLAVFSPSSTAMRMAAAQAPSSAPSSAVERRHAAGPSGTAPRRRARAPSGRAPRASSRSASASGSRSRRSRASWARTESRRIASPRGCVAAIGSSGEIRSGRKSSRSKTTGPAAIAPAVASRSALTASASSAGGVGRLGLGRRRDRARARARRAGRRRGRTRAASARAPRARATRPRR